MFCPKCGGVNQDEVAYCRECGENLMVVSQAMKGHLSVTLVSKFDAVIEKKNERLRRDAILNTLIGSAFLFSGILGLIANNGLFPLHVLMILAGVAAYLSSVWKYLGFRRSSELKTMRRELGEEELIADASVYCPKCGMENSDETSFCPSCGTSLEVAKLPTGMERFMPRSLLTRLDAGVAKNEETPFKPQYRSWSTIMAIAVLFLFSAGGNIIGHNWGSAMTNFVLGLTMVISGGWNLVAYRRTAEKEDLPIDTRPPSRLDAIGPFLRASWLTAVAVLAVCGGMIWYMGIVQAVPLVIIALLVLVGAFLRFWQQNFYQPFVHGILPKSSAHLTPVPTLETSPLAHEPLSITESTTQFLDPLMNDVQQQKAPTTKKLTNLRR